ncbi:PASTA domain-containing protein, partial [Terriglobus sp. TAA 43]|uniref:PASTA domain-containing protein n=1 Tax=Terriglobus sp. TAA 43 TaxID=278961 RepID=UPI000645D800
MKIRIRYHDNSGELSAGAARAFRIGTTVLAMSTVALFSALITMRLAIHTGEVETPSLTGMTLEEAANASNNRKLNLTVENRFYSTTVPAGRVLSQSPAAGANVRKGWHMRITESLGPQRATIPDTVGMNEHDAGMAIRRASLDPGAMAHIPSPGLSDTVLAQTPPANAEGVDKPEVSLLLTEPYTAQPKAWVMPNLVGMSYSAASAKMREIELRVYAIVPIPAPPASTDPSIPAPPPVPMAPAGYVLSQTPTAGARVTAADIAKVKMSAAAAISDPTTLITPTPAANATPPAVKPR